MVLHSSAWSDSQKAALVQYIVSGQLSLQQACTQYGLTVEELKEWVGVFRRSVRQALDQQLRSTLSLQGLDVEELSRPEFSGNLTDMGVADLIQTIQMGRKDAKITISHDGMQSHLWCQGGDVVDAECGGLRGEPALYRILSLDHGSLVADFGSAPHPRRIESSTPRLLLEAGAQRDQRARALRRLGDTRRVFSVVSSVAARKARDLGHEELGVLSLFDGVRSLHEVLLSSELPDQEALEIAVRFFEGGVITPVARKPEEVPASRTGAGLAMTYRPFVASLAPSSGRPPVWVLAGGAVLCSTLGAVTAIAYAEALQQRAAEARANAAQPASAAANAPAEPRLCADDMVLISGGRFFMGSDSSHPALQYARPAHAVGLDSFCLDPREVTVEHYAACVAAGACAAAHEVSNLEADPEAEGAHRSRALHSEQCNAGKVGRDQHPINCVSHREASAYCSYRGGRLPTEAEWEFAAKGSQNRLFPWGNTQPTASHVNACGKECARWHESVGLGSEMHGVMYDEDDGFTGSAPVGSFPLGATPDGVHDLIGNVFEWTAGGLYAYDHSPRTNPVGPTHTDSFVIRGGSFNSGMLEFSDPSLRFAMAGESYSHAVGFRCAADPAPSAAPSMAARIPEPSRGRAPWQGAAAQPPGLPQQR
jgi:formylglycine-generating enzyme required for sulfatase activity